MFTAILTQLRRFFPDITSSTRISFDSRTCKPGDVFFAIKGQNNDGRRFISEMRNNSVYALCDCMDLAEDIDVSGAYVVPNIRSAMRDIVVGAIDSLRHNGCKCIGVTGSSGKTFTKNAIHKILTSAGYASYCTAGNYNTEFGILLSMVDCPEKLDYLVFEMGISKPGDMDVIAEMVRPDMCLILDVAEAHIANFSSRNALVAEKLKLSEYTSGKVVVNKNLESNFHNLYNRDVVFYDTNHVINHNTITLNGCVYELNLKHIRGRHFVENFVGIAALLDGIVALDKMINAFENIEILSGRGNIITLVNPKNNAEFMLYDSSYNANPGPNGSMHRELQTLSEIEAPHKIAVLGQYGEIDQTKDVYEDTLRVVNADETFLVGAHWPVQNIADKIDEINVNDVLDMVLDRVQPGSVLFVKGSNSNGLYQYFIPRLLDVCVRN